MIKIKASRFSGCFPLPIRSGGNKMNFDQIFLTLVVGAFGIFAVVLAWADMSTKQVRESKKN